MAINREQFSDKQGMPLQLVRGGGVCDPKAEGAHILKGSGQPAMCMPTPGPDPRPRYREAGKIGKPSRHSQHFLQHRKGGKPFGRPG